MNNALLLLRLGFRLVASCVVLGWLAEPARAGNPNLLFTKLPDFNDNETTSAPTLLVDLNGDGRPDLIRGGQGSLAVKLGLGSGLFAAGTYYPGGVIVGPIVVADFNNDGKLDVLAANTATADGGTLGVFLGNGDGTLQSQMLVNLGFYIRRFLVTDFNKDGNADIVGIGGHLGNFPTEGTSMTLAGNGNGTFGSPTYYSNSARTGYADTRDVVVADFNGDTWPDYVVSNPLGSGIAVFYNNQNGTFTRRAREMTVGGNIASLATGDFNADGKFDLAVMLASDQTYGNTGADNNVAVVNGNGDGTFGTFSSTFGAFDTIGDARLFRARPGGNTYVRPSARLLSQDMDGDGKLDLVFAAEAGDGLYEVLSILRGGGDGNFSQGAQLTANRFSIWMSAADLNLDGTVDLVVTANDPTTQTYLGIPPGSGTLLVTTALDEDNGTVNPSAGTGTSLREAWNQAMTQVSPQTITFAANLAGQTIYLTNVGDTSQGPTALRAAPGRVVSVQGPSGAGGVTIDCGGVVRSFFVAYDFLGGGTPGNLTLSDLTIQNSRGTYGGAIYNMGTLTMHRCTLTRNTATSLGGAIYNGGGLAPARTMLVNCTLAGNSGAVPGISVGEGQLQMLNVTISSNNASCCGAISVTSGGVVTMTNSIVAGNSPMDISVNGGSVHPDSRYNLVGNISGGLVNGVNGNQVGVTNPRLGPLTNNGGPTLTMALRDNSAARNAGLSVSGLTTDQRGVSRPQESAPDIGAFEYQLVAPQFTGGSAATFAIGANNSFTFTASGAPSPTFSTTSPLPTGLTLSSAGQLTGVPSAGGVFSLNIVADNGVPPGASLNFTLSIVEAPGLIVTTTNDIVAADGLTSLREAFAYAQSLSGPQTITFAPALAGGTVVLGAGWNDVNDTAALRVSGEITLQGLSTSPGVTIAMAPGVQKRHLYVHPGGNLTVSHLTFTGGYGNDFGGSIWSQGSLTVRYCTFTGNTAGTEGGAIQSWGDTPLLLIENSTFSGNHSQGIAGAIDCGATSMSFRHVTIVSNTAANGYAVVIWKNSLTLMNSIIAANPNDGIGSANEGACAPQSSNNILGSGTTAGLTNGVNGNIVGVSAANLLLGPLANNGGPTRTCAPLPGSPAINAGVVIAGITNDQRGVARRSLGGAGLAGRFYALGSAPLPSLLAPISQLESLTPSAFALTPRIDFGAGTETTAGDGTVLTRADTSGNPFGGLGVNVGANNIAALWDGFIIVPETADYRFTTRSDDGSVLFIDGLLVVDNNFLQGMTDRSGTVRLTAGAHAIRAAYFESGGGAGMQLSWEQLNGATPFGRQIIPPSVLASGFTPTIGAVEVLPTAAPAPVITPAAGTYSGVVTVAISSPASGVTIRYTTDGSTPTLTQGRTYTDPFTLPVSATVRAACFGSGWINSQVTSASYIVQNTFASWRSQYLLPADGSQDFNSPAGDGVANIAKYAFNMVPTLGSMSQSNRTVLPPGGTAGLPAITVNPSQQLAFRFVRRKASTNPGVGYLVETSSDLANWTQLALGSALVESIDATWERVTVVDPVSTAMRFGRVKLVRLDGYRNTFTGSPAAMLRGTAIYTNDAIQLTDALQGQLGAVVFDGISAGPGVSGFTARFTMNLGPAGQTVPADGVGFAVGDLGSNAWGESGPATAGHLAISFDTYNNGGDGSIGIRIFTDGVAVASNPLNPYTQGITVPVEINYDVAGGVTVTFNGTVILQNVALPGFVLPNGSKFGIGARTGAAVERAVVDDVEVVTY